MLIATKFRGPVDQAIQPVFWETSLAYLCTDYSTDNCCYGIGIASAAYRLGDSVLEIIMMSDPDLQDDSERTVAITGPPFGNILVFAKLLC